MAITEAFTGSETVGTTEHSMTTDTAGPDLTTTDGIFQIWVDVSAMTAGDQYQIRIYEKVTSGGSQLKVFESVLTGVQPGPFVSPSLILLHGWDATLDKLAGTDRALTWSIRSVA